MALAKGFPALALMSESDLSEDFGPFAAALEAALDPIVADFRRQMVSALGIVFRGLADMYAISERVELGRIILPDGWEASNQAVETGGTLPLSAAAGTCVEYVRFSTCLERTHRQNINTCSQDQPCGHVYSSRHFPLAQAFLVSSSDYDV